VGVIRSIQLGQYPNSVNLDIRRSKKVPTVTLDKSKPGYYRNGVILIPAELWDLLESGLYMNQNFIRCSVCDQLYDTASTYRGDRLKAKGLCFECNFWTEKCENLRTYPREQIVCQARAYVIAPEDVRGMRGFGGAKYVIEFLDTKEVVESTNLWHNGEIPARFRPMMPDTVRFVPQPIHNLFQEITDVSDQEKERRQVPAEKEPEAPGDSSALWVPLQDRTTEGVEELDDDAGSP